MLDLAGILGAAQQFVLETRVRDRQHGGDHVTIGLPAQIGDAVFRHHDVAQMARDGGVAVVPADVRGGAPFAVARRAQQDDRARIIQREALGDEIVLSADPAHDLAVLQPIGDHGAEQGRHHGVVDEARLHARAPLGGLVAIELVDERDRGHAQLGELGSPASPAAPDKTRASPERTPPAAASHRPRA